jgi:iron complex outermembrane receptor protein
VLALQIPFPVDQHTPTAALDDLGIGLYGQGTVTLRERFDLALGARLDHERKDARLDTFFNPPVGASTSLSTDRSFSNLAPQASLAYRVTPARSLYASIGSGFKAGGFNPASPSGAEAYGEEHTWQVEGGVKTTWGGGRVLANAAVFYIDWDDLQLNLPNPQIPAQFYIANVAGARSAGIELEVSGKASADLDLFTVVGYTNGRFRDGSVSSGSDVSDNVLPSTPDYTATFGARYRRAVSGRTAIFGRGEVQLVGAYQYDDANTAGQDAYALTNLRGGVQRGVLSVEGWVKNAFDTRYIPIAFAYPGLAPSGFVGEMGRPRTYGISLSARF